MLTLAVLLIVGNILVAIAASKRDRSSVGWFLISWMITPLLAAPLLFILPRGPLSIETIAAIEATPEGSRARKMMAERNQRKLNIVAKIGFGIAAVGLTMFGLLGIAALIATQAPAANRPYFDGNALLDSCTTNSTTEQAHCFAYVLGVADALSVWKKTAPETSPACPESGVAGAQYKDIGLQYIATKIKERHEPASILLMRAFREQWPCKKPSVSE